MRRGLARSRAHAQQLLEEGAVRVDGRPVSKSSSPVPSRAAIEVAGSPSRWVGRGAVKLRAALERFGSAGLDVSGRRCLDVGAATGGFTQALLAAGAARVTALDVGHGQLAAELAGDPRVEPRCGVNIRDVRPGDLGEPFDVVVVDVSFISLRLVVPLLPALLTEDADGVLLVKPQFEVGRARLGKAGVVRSRADREDAVREVCQAAAEAGLPVLDLLPSPLPGAGGNREYLLWVTRRPHGLAPGELERRIAEMGQR